MSIKDSSDMLHHLECGDKNIILVGTAHVSRESAQQVSHTIQQEKPDTVCVELCQSRYQSIRQKERWQETDIVKIIKERKSFLLLSNLLLASFQKRIAKKLDIKPGQEMIKAVETAEEEDAAVHLADRDLDLAISVQIADRLFECCLAGRGGLGDPTGGEVAIVLRCDPVE
mgnify:CR=1 FL=1